MTVAGHDVKEYDLDFLRKQVAMVLQTNVLFSGTIKENMRWGNKDATDEEIIEACKIAQADEFIQDFKEGYDTMIERGGSNVSGGQRQRLWWSTPTSLYRACPSHESEDFDLG